VGSYRRVLKVFLASPGDLAGERRAAKVVVDEVALTARELNWSIELLGWEDTLPGAPAATRSDQRGLRLVGPFRWVDMATMGSAHRTPGLFIRV